MSDVKFINDRWLNKEFETIAIKVKGKWTYYKKI